MKTLGLIAAAAAAMLLAPAAASAAPVAAPASPVSAMALADSQVRVVVQDRSHSRYRGHHRRSYWRTVCTRKWRHGRSYRTCRRVRSWR